MKLLPALAAALLAASLLAGCQSPPSPDSDKDGLTDAEELGGWEVTVLRLDGTTATRHVASDPSKWSTDGSALDDHYKFALGLDPHAADTDGDGLTDCQEARDRNLSKCSDPDAPGPFDGGYTTLGNRVDTDGDGLGDGAEVTGFDIPAPGGGTRHATSDPLRADTDRDGLLDGQEAATGADPRTADTDGDGCRDGLDVDPVHDLKLLPGLRSLAWTAPAGHVQFILNLGGAAWTLPAQGGIDVSPGQNRSLADLAPEPARPTCSFSPAHPWLPLQVLAYRTDGARGRADIGGNATTGAAGYVNGRTGAYALDGEGLHPVANLVLRGGDGTLWLAPERVTSSPQAT
jgi:hypothetical protein